MLRASGIDLIQNNIRVNTVNSKKAVRLALLPAAISLSLHAAAATPTTPITNVIVLYQEDAYHERHHSFPGE
jgi:hypothetical protein